MKKIIFLLTLIQIISACASGGKTVKTTPELAIKSEKNEVKNQPPKTTPIKKEPEIMVKEQKAPQAQESPILSISKKSFYKRVVLYSRSFYPFFVDRGEVPFGVKIKLEKSVKRIKRLLKRYRKARIVVKGYTSRKGKTRDNLRLSLWRARNTARYISWKAKISLKKFRIYGKGELAKNSQQARQVKVFVVK